MATLRDDPITRWATSNTPEPAAPEPAAPERPGLLRRAADSFMPQTRALMAETGPAMVKSLREGDYAGAIGQFAGGVALRAPMAMMQDRNPVVQQAMANPDLGRQANDFAQRAVQTAWTGEVAPQTLRAGISTAGAGRGTAPDPRSVAPAGWTPGAAQAQMNEPAPVRAPVTQARQLDGSTARYDTPGQSPLYTNLPLTDPSNVTLRNAGRVSTQNMGAADALASRSGSEATARAAAGEGYGLGAPAAPTTLRDGGRWVGAMYRTGDQLRADADTQASSIVGSTAARGRRAQEAFENQDVANIQSAGRAQEAAISAGAQRYGADQRLRGDIFQADASRGSARVKLQLDMMKADRDYQLDKAKLGETQAKRMFDQRQDSEKGLNDRLQTMFRTKDADGKDVADTARVASARGAVQSYLQTQIKNAVDNGRQDIADQLRQSGVQGIGEDRLQRILQLEEVRGISQQAHGMGPWSGTHVDSADPESYAITGREQRLFRPNVVTLRNGAVVPERDLTRGGSLNPWAVQSDRYNTLREVR